MNPLQAVCSFLLCCYAYGALVEPRLLHLTRRDITLPKLPAALDGLSILLLSDLHTTRWSFLERRTLKLLQSCEYDLLVLDGDYANSASGIEPLMRIIRASKPGLGAFAVKGNTEHKDDIAQTWPHLREKMRQAGVTVLENQPHRLALPEREAAVWIGGVDDAFLHAARLGEVLPPPGEAADLRMLISHSPDILEDDRCSQFELILSGHTHGGQVRLPFLHAFYSHTRLGGWVADGLVSPATIAKRLGRPLPQPTLYVGRGVGTVGRGPVWLRFGCRPEVCLLRLVKG
ncbi:MAG: metallophosphoesterase [Armatimonadota bacterium]